MGNVAGAAECLKVYRIIVLSVSVPMMHVSFRIAAHHAERLTEHFAVCFSGDMVEALFTFGGRS